MGSIFLAAMDITAVAPAMPRIVGDLGGGALYAWAFSIYAVLSTTTTPVFGRLADRRGRKPVLLAGIGIFLVGSIASGAAPTMPLFILARAVQGLGAGAVLPVSFTIVGDLYDLKARARIQGYLSGVWGVASVVGPLVGGTLVATVGWRWLFYINIPVGLAAAAVLARSLREEGYPRPGAKLDFWGGTFFSGAVLLLLLGLKLEGHERWLALAGAVGAAFVFVLRERRATDPIFDLALFRIPVYRAANASGFFAGAVLLSISAYLPIYVMNVRGGSPVVSGLMLTPLSFGWVTAATLSGRLLVKHDFRKLVIPGLAILALTTFGVSCFTPTVSYAIVCLVMVATGVAFGLSFTTFLVAVQEEVETARRGQATSAVQFFRQIGGALGVAVLELVYVSRLSEPKLLEAARDRVFTASERSELMDGFGAAFLVATGLAAAAVLAGLLSPGRGSKRRPGGG
jgi:EmrB/QacA subfamily drug resistance transporter